MIENLMSGRKAAETKVKKAEDDKEDVESSLENSLVTLKSCDVGSVKVVTRQLVSRPKWQEAAIKEQELTVLMQSIKDNLIEMDCVMIRQILYEKKKSKNKGDSAEYATEVVEDRMKDAPTKQEERKQKQEEERKQRVVIESCPEQ